MRYPPATAYHRHHRARGRRHPAAVRRGTRNADPPDFVLFDGHPLARPTDLQGTKTVIKDGALWAAAR